MIRAPVAVEVHHAGGDAFDDVDHQLDRKVAPNHPVEGPLQPSPGADVAGVGPSPGVNVGGVGPVPLQMWQRFDGLMGDLLHVLHNHAHAVLHLADFDDPEQLDHIRVAEPPKQLHSSSSILRYQ